MSEEIEEDDKRGVFRSISLQTKSYRFSTEILVVSLELNYMYIFYLGVNPNASKIGVSKLNGMRNRHGNDKPAEV